MKQSQIEGRKSGKGLKEKMVVKERHLTCEERHAWINSKKTEKEREGMIQILIEKKTESKEKETRENNIEKDKE